MKHQFIEQLRPLADSTNTDSPRFSTVPRSIGCVEKRNEREANIIMVSIQYSPVNRRACFKA